MYQTSDPAVVLSQSQQHVLLYHVINKGNLLIECQTPTRTIQLDPTILTQARLPLSLDYIYTTDGLSSIFFHSGINQDAPKLNHGFKQKIKCARRAKGQIPVCSYPLDFSAIPKILLSRELVPPAT